MDCFQMIESSAYSLLFLWQAKCSQQPLQLLSIDSYPNFDVLQLNPLSWAKPFIGAPAASCVAVAVVLFGLSARPSLLQTELGRCNEASLWQSFSVTRPAQSPNSNRPPFENNKHALGAFGNRTLLTRREILEAVVPTNATVLLQFTTPVPASYICCVRAES